MIYGPRELAESFRTVRRNTILIAEDIPEDKYDFRPAPDVRSVGQILAHIAVSPMWQAEAHRQRVSSISREDFLVRVAAAAAEEQALTTKPAIVDALAKKGEAFAEFLQSATPELLAETVSFPPPVQPSSRSRFEMLLGTKEHEMHHRAQLMVYQRLLGIVPHLTRARQQVAAQPAGR